MKKKINIAIDGPAASGKSTTAKLLAKKLGFIYVDTGAMYRAATLHILRNHIDPGNETAVLSCLSDMNISIKLVNGEQRTYLNGEDVSDLLRTPEINRAISAIASYKPGYQRYCLLSRSTNDDGAPAAAAGIRRRGNYGRPRYRYCSFTGR